MRPLPIAQWSDVPDREPMGALVGNVDLVIVRYDDEHSVLLGRCGHRGALLADGSVRGSVGSLLAPYTIWRSNSKIVLSLDSVPMNVRVSRSPTQASAFSTVEVRS